VRLGHKGWGVEAQVQAAYRREPLPALGPVLLDRWHTMPQYPVSQTQACRSSLQVPWLEHLVSAQKD
jgi:hypothetical protein